MSRRAIQMMRFVVGVFTFVVFFTTNLNLHGLFYRLDFGVNRAEAQSAFNKQINYQGKISDSSGNAVADGDYDIEFKLYDSLTGGSLLWTETRATTTQVTVKDGLFSVLLGEVNSISSIDFNQDLYLTINFNSDGEMTPRKYFGAVPAAFEADKLDGIDSTEFLRSNTSDSFTSGTLTFDSGTTLQVDGSTILTNATATNATTTDLNISGDLGINSEYFTDLTGAGLENSSGVLSIRTDCSAGQILEWNSGSSSWDCGTDNAGSGGAGLWATTTDNLIVYPVDTTDVVVIGSNATSTTGNILEVVGNSLLAGTLTSYGLSSAPYFTATTTATSTLPQLDATTLQLSSGLQIDSITGALLATDSNGVVVATSTISSSLIEDVYLRNDTADSATGLITFTSGLLSQASSTITALTSLTSTSTNSTTTDLYVSSDFTLGSDTVSDLTGTGLSVSGGALNVDLGTSVDLTSEVTGILPVANGGTATDTPSQFLFGTGSAIVSTSTISQNFLDAALLRTGDFGDQFYTFFNATNTDALSEGSSNLYWTNDRFDARLAASTSLPTLTTLANLTTVGTIGTGVWQGTVIDEAYGGTGTSSPYNFLFGDGTNLVSTSSIAQNFIDSAIARDSELHDAVTVTGEDYLSLSTQQITANAINPDNLASTDFGDFTCNGTTCSLDAGVAGDSFAWTPSTTYSETANATSTPIWLQDTLYASSTAFIDGLATIANSTTTHATITNLYVNNDHITDLTGTGLELSGTSLTATLGTSIDDSEVDDNITLTNITQITNRALSSLQAATLGNLADVATTGVAIGDVLMWDGSNWVDTSTSSLLTATELDTEAELESALTDVTNVFTNNDGALNDDDITDDSIESLSDVASITNDYGDLFYWNGSAWADIATSSLGLVQDSDLASYLTLSAWYSTTTDQLSEGSTNLYYTNARVDSHLSGGEGITYSSGAISFDCSEVEGTGINCSGEDITLDYAADSTWTGHHIFSSLFATNASSTNATTSTFAITSLANALLATDSNGTVVATTTIGANLIDSAIARDSELHDAVTVSGSYDYITLSGQDIVRGQIDLTTDVTGELPDANVANDITLTNITQITNRALSSLQAATLGNLADVATSGVAIGNILMWDGTNWVDQATSSDTFQDLVTLAGENYLTLSGQEITANAVNLGGSNVTGTLDVSDHLNLTGGTNITLSGDTLNVDDAFLLNTGDSATGDYTFDTDTLVIDSTNNRVGFGTSSPYTTLAVVGETVASHFTATTTSTSTLPQLDVTGIEASTYFQLGSDAITDITGDGLVVTAGALGLTEACSNNEILKYVGGTWTCATDVSGGGGGSGVWATTTDELAIYPTDTTDVVIVGSSATTTTGNIFEVVGSALFDAISASGNIDFDGGSFTFNESGADRDFRIEGDTEQNLFFADASTDRIGVGTSTPPNALTLDGGVISLHNSASGNQTITIESNGQDTNQSDILFDTSGLISAEKHLYFSFDANDNGGDDAFIVGHNATTTHADGSFSELFRIDGTGYVGIGTSSPYVALGVAGDVVADSFTATTTSTSTLPQLDVTGIEASTYFQLGSDAITDITGTGLSNTAGVLTLDTSGDWTGTFDGQEGSYYLDADNLTDFGNQFYTFFNATNTDALSEGSTNLYFTNARVDDRINASTTIFTTPTEAGLQAFLTDVTDVFTNNDGALADDDLSDDTLNSLSQTSLADPNADQIVFWDDSDTQFEFISTLTGLTITGNTLAVDESGIFAWTPATNYNEAVNSTTTAIWIQENLYASSTIYGPNFIAEDVAATSTFAGGLTVDSTDFVVDPDAGRVGIGTSSPGHVLSVGSFDNPTLYGTVGIKIDSDDVAISIEEDGGGSESWGIGVDNDGDFNLHDSGAAASKILFTILDGTGNVGVGTTSPYARLSVAGETVASHFTATTTSTSTLPELDVTGIEVATSFQLGSDVLTDITGDGLTISGTSLTTSLGSSVDISDETNLASTWPIVLTDDTLSFDGLSTSSAAVVGNIPYFSGANTFDNVATTSATIGTGLSYSGTFGSLIGGSAGTLSIDQAGITRNWGYDSTYGESVITPTTTIPVWLKDSLYASSTSIFDGLLTFINATGTQLTLTDLFISGDHINDFAGTGLSVSGNALTADLGTSIESSEITDNEIVEADLSINAPTNNYILTASSSATGGWEWVATTSANLGLVQTSDLHDAVTLAGENYLTLSGQEITANAVNLGGSNVTGTLDVSDHLNLTGGTGITLTGDDLSFDCSEVEGTGINCSGESITLDATGDWTGTLDGIEGANFLRSDTADTAAGLITFTSGLLSQASSTITALTTLTSTSTSATTTNFAISSLTGALLATDANGVVIATSTIASALIEDGFLVNNADDTTTGSLTATEFVANAASATSTFAGGLTVDSTDLVVDPDAGRVGIGTADPEMALHVAGGSSGDILLDNNGALRWKDSGGVRHDILTLDSSDDVKIGNASISNSDIIIRSGGVSDAVTIRRTTGNVGIGTSSPYARLSVVGEAVASHFTATTTSTSTLPQLDVTGIEASTYFQLGSDVVTDLTGSGLSIVGGALTASGGDSFAWTPATTYNETANSTTTPIWLQDSLYASSTAFFNDRVTFASTTAGSVYFAGEDGVLSEDNTNLYWDDANNRLGIGTSSPAKSLNVEAGPDDGIRIGRFALLQRNDFATHSILQAQNSTSSNSVFSIAPKITAGGEQDSLGVLEIFATDFQADSTNFERLSVYAELGQPFRIFSNAGGTGTNRDIVLTASSTGGTTDDSQLYLKTDGNVGIGTTSPYARLSVVGEVAASHFTATTSATSTFAGAIDVTESNATSTFAHGIDVAAGCLAVNGTCVASSAELHDAVTVSGSYDYITLSGQDIVRGQIDLTTDVTGELPDANVANDITLTNITQITNRAISDTTGTLAANRGGTGSSSPSSFFYGPNDGTLISTSTIAQNFIDSAIARDSELHDAVTVTGEDYLSLSTQQITANAINPDNLASTDFGDFTCNGTTCSLDAGVAGDSFAWTPATNYNEAVNSTTTAIWIQENLYASSTIYGPNFIAEDVAATSTFAGGLAVETSGLVYDYSSNNVGVGTASPGQKLDVLGFVNVDSGSGYKQNDVTILHYGSNDNIAAGENALASLSGGLRNSAFGNDALTALGGGLDNTAVGSDALETVGGGSRNTAVGSGAGSSVAGVSDNTFIGKDAGTAVTGSRNTFLGSLAGDSATSGDDNILIGYNVDTPAVGTDDHLNIGNTLYGDLTNGFIGIGSSSPYTALGVAGDVVADSFFATTTATSTFAGAIDVTESNATSTFAHGIDVAAGCLAVNGTCLSAHDEVTLAGENYLTLSGQEITANAVNLGGSNVTGTLDVSDHLNLTGGTGITLTGDDLSFDCSEVEGTGINCSGESITLDATGDWTGTLDGIEGANFLRSDTADTAAGLITFTSGLLSQASSTITALTTLTSTSTAATSTDLYATEFGINNEYITDLTGAGLSISSGALTTTLGTSIDLTSEVTGILPLANGGTATSTWQDGYVVYYDDAKGTLSQDTVNSFFWDDSTGRLGIGDVTPARELEVKGYVRLTDEDDRIEFTDTGSYISYSSASGGLLISDDAEARIGYNGNVRLIVGNNEISTEGSADFKVDSGLILADASENKVGINDSTPTYSLDVTGDARFTSYVDASHFIATSTTATSTFAGGLVVDTSDFVVDPDAGWIGIGTSSPNSNLVINSDNPADGLEQVRVYSAESATGNNGFGVFATGGNNANLRLSADTDLTAVAQVLLVDADDSSNAGYLILERATSPVLDTSSQNDLLLGNNTSGGSLIFSTEDVERARINSTGLGIGTTSPYTALGVAGDVVADSFFATTTATSTFAGAIDVTESNATSTFAHGIDVAAGCLAVNGNCVVSGTDFDTYLELTDTQSSFNANRVVHTNGAGNALTDTDGFVFTGTKLGIGTSSPLSSLTIQESDASGGTEPRILVSNTSTATHSFAHLTVNANDMAVGGSFVADGLGTGGAISGDDAGVAIGSDTNHPLVFFTNFTEAARFDTSGRLGIGTTSPLAELHIEGGSPRATTSAVFTSEQLLVDDLDAGINILSSPGGNLGSRITFTEADGTDLINKWMIARKTVTGGNDLIYTFGTANDGNSNTEFFRFTDTGEFGVGTSSPGAPIEIHTDSGNSSLRVTADDDGTGGNPFVLFTGDYDGTPKYGFVGLDTSADLVRLVHGSSFDNSTNGLAVDSSGNVGIGTNSPGTKLTVSGQAAIGTTTLASGFEAVIANAGATGAAGLLLDIHGTTGTSKVSFGDDDSNTVGELVYVHSDDQFKIVTNGSDRLYINSDGRVGIADSTPTYQLDVTGDAHFTSYVDASHFTATTTSTSTLPQLDVTDIQVAGGVDISGDFINDFNGTGLTVSSNALAVDLNELTTETSIASGDYIAMVDITDSGSGKITYSNFLNGFDVESLGTSLTAGSVVFSDGSNLAQDNANFFWDDTNNHLGISSTSPSAYLTIDENVDDELIALYGSTNNNYLLDIWNGGGAAKGVRIRAGDGTGSDASILSVQSSAASPVTYFTVADGNSYFENGNLGIRDTDPTYSLEVSGDGRFTSLVDATNFIATSTSATSTFAGGLTVDTDSLVVDFSSNNVGIGTSSPEGLLHVGSGLATNDFFGATTDGVIVSPGTNTGRVYIEGQTNADIIFYDATGSADQRMAQISLQGEDINFNAYNDSAVKTYDLLTMNMSNGDLYIGGDTAGASDILLGNDGEAIFNEQSNNLDFRIESNNDTHAFFVDGSADNIGIGTSSPYAKLSVVGETVASHFTATTTTATSTFMGLTANAISLNSDVISDFTGTGLSVSNGVLNADVQSSDIVPFAWTPTTNYSESVNATATPIWLQDSLYASSTIAIDGPSGNIYTTADEGIYTSVGVLLEAESGDPFVVAKLGTSDNTSAFGVYNSSDDDVLYVRGDGRVGINNDSPGSMAHIGSGSATKFFYSAGVRDGLTINPGVSTGRLYIEGSDYADILMYDSGGTADQRFAQMVLGDQIWELASYTDAGVRQHRFLTADLSDGNVGIGTTDPTANLHVYDNDGSTQLTIEDDNYDNFLNISSEWYGGLLATTCGNGCDLVLAPGGSGNVGIETTDPLYTLDITGSARVTSYVDASHFVATSTTATSTFAGGLTVDTSDFVVDPDAGRVGIGTTSPWGKFSVTNSGTDPSFVVEDTSSPDSSPFLIDASGNVGVGTQSPATDFHIYVDDTTTGKLALIDQDGTGDAALSFRLTGTEEWIMGVDNSDSDTFKITDGGALADSDDFTITTGGNVGIGTTTNPAQLTIQNSGDEDGLYIYGSTNNNYGLRVYNGGGSAGGIEVRGGNSGSDASLLHIRDAVTGNSFFTVTDGNSYFENGNVGVSSTTPSEALTLGTGTGSSGRYVLGFNSSGWGDPAAPGSSSNGDKIELWDSGTQKSAIGFSANNDLWFQSNTTGAGFEFWTGNDSTTPTEKVTINSAGKLGIGSTTPTANLAVNSAEDDLAFAIGSSTDGYLLEAKHLNNNFGLSLNAGAFIDRNSYFGEEFNSEQNLIQANVQGGQLGSGLGDTGSWGTIENTGANCNYVSGQDEVNGTVQITPSSTSDGCAGFWATDTIGNGQLIADADNLPVMLMKMHQDDADSGNVSWIGISSDIYTAAQLATSDPENFIGFSSDAGSTWTGVTTNSATKTSVTCTGATVGSSFALGMVEVISTSEVRFYIDEDVSDGIDLKYCGASTTNIPTSALTPYILYQARAAGTINQTLSVDFFRMWQDDNISSPELVFESTRTLEVPVEDIARQNSETRAYGVENAESLSSGDVVALDVPLKLDNVVIADDTNEVFVAGVVRTNDKERSRVTVTYAGNEVVNASNSGGEIEAGDFLRLSSVAGSVMKTTEPGMVVGVALGDGYTDPETGKYKVLISINKHWYAGENEEKINDFLSVLGEQEDEKIEEIFVEELSGEIVEDEVVVDSFWTLAEDGSIEPLHNLDLAGKAIENVREVLSEDGDWRITADGHVYAKSLHVDELHAEVLCVGSTCITEDQLRELLDASDSYAAPAPPPIVESEPEEETTEEVTEEPVEETATSTPEIIEEETATSTPEVIEETPVVEETAEEPIEEEVVEEPEPEPVVEEEPVEEVVEGVIEEESSPEPAPEPPVEPEPAPEPEPEPEVAEPEPVE